MKKSEAIAKSLKMADAAEKSYIVYQDQELEAEFGKEGSYNCRPIALWYSMQERNMPGITFICEVAANGKIFYPSKPPQA